MSKLVCALAAIALLAVSIPTEGFAAKKKAAAAPKAPPCQPMFFGPPCPAPGAKTAKK